MARIGAIETKIVVTTSLFLFFRKGFAVEANLLLGRWTRDTRTGCAGSFLARRGFGRRFESFGRCLGKVLDRCGQFLFLLEAIY